MVLELTDPYTRGPYVRAWQRIIGLRGHEVDGTFGPNTATRVAVWQGSRGIEPDAVIGPLTRAAVKPGDLIKPFEGLRLWTYDDHDGARLRFANREWRRPDGALVLGTATIGWGDTAHPRQGIETCTREDADLWFDQDLEVVRMPYVRRYAPEGADAATLAAMASFAYNCGTGALGALAKAGFAAETWLDYDRDHGVPSAGLRMRREEELALFSVA